MSNDEEVLIKLPEKKVLEEVIKKVFPHGNIYHHLAFRLSKGSGEEVNAEGVYNWILYAFIEEEMLPIAYRLIPQIIENIIENKTVREKAKKIAEERLREVAIIQ